MHLTWRLLMHSKYMSIDSVQALTATNKALWTMTQPFLKALCLAGVLLLRRLRRANRLHPWPLKVDFGTYYQRSLSYQKKQHFRRDGREAQKSARQALRAFFPLAWVVVDTLPTLRQINAALWAVHTRKRNQSPMSY